MPAEPAAKVAISRPRWAISIRVGALPEFVLESSASRLAITGPSGVGKTTLLRAVAGVEERAQGVVRVDGETWLDSAARARVPAWERKVGWAPQDALLFPHLDVRENLLAATGAHHDELGAVVRGLELSHLVSRRPRHLSGGERQRVSLGRALLADARVLLLDEPFSALDRALRTRVVAFVRQELFRRPRALLLVTHDADRAASLVDETWELASDGLSIHDSA